MILRGRPAEIGTRPAEDSPEPETAPLFGAEGRTNRPLPPRARFERVTIRLREASAPVHRETRSSQRHAKDARASPICHTTGAALRTQGCGQYLHARPRAGAARPAVRTCGRRARTAQRASYSQPRTPRPARAFLPSFKASPARRGRSRDDASMAARIPVLRAAPTRGSPVRTFASGNGLPSPHPRPSIGRTGIQEYNHG